MAESFTITFCGFHFFSSSHALWDVLPLPRARIPYNRLCFLPSILHRMSHLLVGQGVVGEGNRGNCLHRGVGLGFLFDVLEMCWFWGVYLLGWRQWRKNTAPIVVCIRARGDEIEDDFSMKTAGFPITSIKSGTMKFLWIFSLLWKSTSKLNPTTSEVEKTISEVAAPPSPKC